MLNPNVKNFKLHLSCEGNSTWKTFSKTCGAFTQKNYTNNLEIMESKWAWWKISSSGKSWVITRDGVNNPRYSSGHKGHNGLSSSSPVSEDVAGPILTSQTPWLHCQLFCQTLSSVWQAIISNGLPCLRALVQGHCPPRCVSTAVGILLLASDLQGDKWICLKMASSGYDRLVLECATGFMLWHLCGGLISYYICVMDQS